MSKNFLYYASFHQIPNSFSKSLQYLFSQSVIFDFIAWYRQKAKSITQKSFSQNSSTSKNPLASITETKGFDSFSSYFISQKNLIFLDFYSNPGGRQNYRAFVLTRSCPSFLANLKLLLFTLPLFPLYKINSFSRRIVQRFFFLFFLCKKTPLPQINCPIICKKCCQVNRCILF